MRILVALMLWVALAVGAMAQQQNPTGTAAAQDAAPALDIRDAKDVVLADFLWLNRLVVVFADSARDPVFQEQIELLKERPEDLLERDVVVVIDTDPENPTAVREKLRPRGFGLVLIDKDGVIKLRKPAPWDVREISRSIDKTDLRQQELREERAGGA